MNAHLKRCPTCDGRGYVLTTNPAILSNTDRPRLCPLCEGACWVVPAGPRIVTVDEHGNVTYVKLSWTDAVE